MEPELHEESVAEKPVVHPRFVAELFTQMAQDAIKEEGPTGDIVMVLRKLEDFYSETWEFEFYALHQAAQQMAIQSDGRLMRHALSISGQTDYDFSHSMEPSRLAEKKSKEDLAKGMIIAPEVVMSGELEEVLDVRISAYMECLNQFGAGRQAAAMRLFDLGPIDSLKIFACLSELLIFYKGLLDGLKFVV